ncbi:MAG: tRNA (adenosine(37)-N6)-dimethylallyltransferase MiaA [Aquificaceae bacterium]
MLIITGPTASGKSELCCALAIALRGEILSVDSMMVYKKMDIGTAKPLECMQKVKHYLVDILEINQRFDAMIFLKLAKDALREIHSSGRLAIVCGGTYLYLQALVMGLDETPEPDFELRKRLYEIAKKRGKTWLYQKLLSIDKSYAKRIHPNDLRRIVRALEVFINSGRAFSSFQKSFKKEPKIEGFYIDIDLKELKERIEQRVDRMLKEGLIQEVKHLIQNGFEGFITSSQAIGYKELIGYIKGEKTLQEARTEIVKNTLKLAKRQIRWMRAQSWLKPVKREAAFEEILKRAPEAGRIRDLELNLEG